MLLPTLVLILYSIVLDFTIGKISFFFRLLGISKPHNLAYIDIILYWHNIVNSYFTNLFYMCIHHYQTLVISDKALCCTLIP